MKNPEDGFIRCAQLVMQVFQRKNELNVVTLDKRKIKEGTFQNFAQTPVS